MRGDIRDSPCPLIQGIRRLGAMGIDLNVWNGGCKKCRCAPLLFFFVFLFRHGIDADSMRRQPLAVHAMIATSN